MRGLGVPTVNARARRLAGHFLAAGALAAGVAGCGQIDNRPAEWGYISPAIFQPNCATTSCHSPAAAVSGLDFSTPENGYSSLTRLWTSVIYPPDAGLPPNTPCGVVDQTRVCQEKVRPLVTPFDPEGSRLVNMLLARDAPRMPPDRPLPMADIRLIETWILNGAFEYANGTGPADAGHDAADAARDATADATSDALPPDGVGNHDGTADEP